MTLKVVLWKKMAKNVDFDDFWKTGTWNQKLLFLSTVWPFIYTNFTHLIQKYFPNIPHECLIIINILCHICHFFLDIPVNLTKLTVLEIFQCWWTNHSQTIHFLYQSWYIWCNFGVLPVIVKFFGFFGFLVVLVGKYCFLSMLQVDC